MNDPAEPVGNPNTAFEPADWTLRPVALTLLGIVMMVMVALLILRASFVTVLSDASRPLTVAMPQPRLQVAPAIDLTALRAREDRDLNTYYWIDRDKGIVHIPIEAAMQQVAGRGLDGFPPPPPK